MSVKGNKGWKKDIRVRGRRGGCQCGKKSPGRLPIHEMERWELELWGWREERSRGETATMEFYLVLRRVCLLQDTGHRAQGQEAGGWMFLQ